MISWNIRVALSADARLERVNFDQLIQGQAVLHLVS
jgi:hypothetical protein